VKSVQDLVALGRDMYNTPFQALLVKMTLRTMIVDWGGGALRAQRRRREVEGVTGERDILASSGTVAATMMAAGCVTLHASEKIRKKEDRRTGRERQTWLS